MEQSQKIDGRTDSSRSSMSAGLALEAVSFRFDLVFWLRPEGYPHCDLPQRIHRVGRDNSWPLVFFSSSCTTLVKSICQLKSIILNNTCLVRFFHVITMVITSSLLSRLLFFGPRLRIEINKVQENTESNTGPLRIQGQLRYWLVIARSKTLDLLWI